MSSGIPGTDGFGELLLTSWRDENGSVLWIDRADRRIRVTSFMLDTWAAGGLPDYVTRDGPLFTIRASNGTVTYRLGEADGRGQSFAAELVAAGTGTGEP